MNPPSPSPTSWFPLLLALAFVSSGCSEMEILFETGVALPSDGGSDLSSDESSSSEEEDALVKESIHGDSSSNDPEGDGTDQGESALGAPDDENPGSEDLPGAGSNPDAPSSGGSEDEADSPDNANSGVPGQGDDVSHDSTDETLTQDNTIGLEPADQNSAALHEPTDHQSEPETEDGEGSSPEGEADNPTTEDEVHVLADASSNEEPDPGHAPEFEEPVELHEDGAEEDANASEDPTLAGDHDVETPEDDIATEEDFLSPDEDLANPDEENPAADETGSVDEDIPADDAAYPEESDACQKSDTNDWIHTEFTTEIYFESFPAWMPGSLEDGMEDGAEIVEAALPAQLEEMNTSINQWLADFHCPEQCTRNEEIQYPTASPIQHNTFGNQVLSYAVVEGSAEVNCGDGISDLSIDDEDSSEDPITDQDKPNAASEDEDDFGDDDDFTDPEEDDSGDSESGDDVADEADDASSPEETTDEPGDALPAHLCDEPAAEMSDELCSETGMDCTGADTEPSPELDCSAVDIDKELMITDLSVIEDPERTFDGCHGTPMGAWTFGRLMTSMAGDEDASTFTLNWLEQWTMDQQLNGFISPARMSIEDEIIDPWLARSEGDSLDLAKAPFRLLAIVNRIDLRKTTSDSFNAGEGRFVFGLVDVENNCDPREFVVIFEYGQPASSTEEIQDWAHSWHDLGTHEFGPSYNAALQGVTDDFVGPGADPTKPNGSSINQIRTNEIALAGPWELREFRVMANGQLAQVSVKQEPGSGLRNSPVLAQWINDNEEEVLNSTHVVPGDMLGPAAPVTGLWVPQGVDNPDARHSFALNTCSGCHQAETGAPFLHVGSRFPGEQTPLSGFLTGTTISDPVSGALRAFNDLERRQLDLCSIVNPDASEDDVLEVDVAPACSAD